MALSSKLETEVEIKSSADSFFKRIKAENHHIPNAAADKVHGVEVHEGDWETTGSIKHWTYTVEGVVETLKEKVEIDEENKKVTLVALEGHCLDDYKAYKAVFQVTPKSEGGGGVVAITLVCEKRRNDSPEPNKYLQFLIALVKDIDAHLLQVDV